MEKASDQGNMDAIVNLGHIYLSLPKTPENVSNAYRIFRKGADLNHQDSILHIGIFYRDGVILKKNEKYAFQMIILEY